MRELLVKKLKNDKFYTKGEAAKHMSISYPTFRKYFDDIKPAIVSVDKNAELFLGSDVNELIDKQVSKKNMRIRTR